MRRKTLKNLSQRRLSSLLHQAAFILALVALAWSFLRETDLLTSFYQVIVVYLAASIMAYMLEIALIRAHIWSEQAAHSPESEEESAVLDEDNHTLGQRADSGAVKP